MLAREMLRGFLDALHQQIPAFEFAGLGAYEAEHGTSALRE